MPLARVNANIDPGMQQLYNMFRVNPNAFAGVNPGAFSEEANNEIAQTTAQHNVLSPEKRGEQELLDNADQRAEVGIRSDLAEADAVRQARNMGYNGSHPLKDQAETQARQKLQMMLAPEQMKLQASLIDKDNQREFTAGQNKLNRESMMERTQVGQQGQSQRQTEAAANAAAKSVKLGHNPLRSLFGGVIPGYQSNEQVQQAEANRMRESVRGQMNQQQNAVAMQAPDGRRLMVPAEKVEELEAAGAMRIQ